MENYASTFSFCCRYSNLTILTFDHRNERTHKRIRSQKIPIVAHSPLIHLLATHLLRAGHNSNISEMTFYDLTT
jgi:hypothetical protein